MLLVMELLMSCEEEESLREGQGGARRGALAGIVPLTLAQGGQGDPRDLPAPITQERGGLGEGPRSQSLLSIEEGA